MAAYICEGTHVKTADAREGVVHHVDRANRIAFIQSAHNFFSEHLDNLKVVSYKGVMEDARA